jgi:hypothetical protein
MRICLAETSVIVAAMLCGFSVQAGPDWIEHGDAGALPSSAETTSGPVGGSIGRISGGLDGLGAPLVGGFGGDFEDMYLIRIDNPLLFCATTVPCGDGCGSAEFNTQLWLFNANGLGLLGNNDTPTSQLLGAPLATGSTLGPFACDETQSSIPEPGLYYLAISHNNIPQSTGGPIFAFDDQNLCGLGELSGPDGPGGGAPITGWSINSVDFDIEVREGSSGDFATSFSLGGIETANPQVASNAGAIFDPSELNEWNIAWNFGSDADGTSGQAHIGSGFTIENTVPEQPDADAGDLHFVITLKLDMIAPDGPALVGGNAGITLLTRPSPTSSPGELASLSGPVWNGIINGEDVAGLFPHPYSLTGTSTPGSGSTSVANGVVPAFAYAGHVESLSIRLEFSLTPGEKVTFNGIFAMMPVAEGAGTTTMPGQYVIHLCGTSPAVTQVELPMDIKPGGCPNPFNRTSHGVLPVSLLGTDSLDIGNVVLSSVRMSRPDGMGGSIGNLAPHEGPPGPHSTYEDTGTPFDGELCECHNVGGDGITDLSMKFVSDDIVEELELEALPGGSVVEINLTGELTSGESFIARDCILLMPPHLTGDTLEVRTNLTGTWVNISVPDANLDAGGFGTAFSRTYSQNTMVMLSAQTWPGGPEFLGWRVKSHKQLVTSPTLKVRVSGATQSVEAVFSNAADGVVVDP